jgi:hypothetical protein
MSRYIYISEEYYGSERVLETDINGRRDDCEYNTKKVAAYDCNCTVITIIDIAVSTAYTIAVANYQAQSYAQ